MGIKFFIGPFDPALWEYGNPDPAPTTDLRIEPEDYSPKLLEHWPHAKSHALRSWSLDESDRPGIYVSLQTNLQYISFGLGANFTDFILWHRQIIPPKYTLFLFNSSAWDSLKLLPNTTRQEIQDFTKIRDV